jgi:serine/threonine protein kinase
VNDEAWAAVEAHFDALRELSGDQRAAGLAAIPDEEIRREVASLLEHSTDGGTVAAAVSSAVSGLDSAFAGEHLGPYRLVRRLGQGGQGAVFEAVRDDGRFEQRVAIKIVKWEMDSEPARRRFRDERQMLAGLQHPYIARLLDGGETPNGTPYLVMEFIDGRELIEGAEGWNARRKLELFVKVAEAVGVAHRNLIVHRDLKPANILITQEGDPKLLDFGIAKLLDAGADRTQTLLRALTPDYASPEQVRGLPISTASDVYSLGVVLYELLTGRKPYRLETPTSMEMDRVICQQPPEPAGLNSELDSILAMALRKEPERRYSGTEQFAGDIRRYLEGRPVLARPDTLAYRTRKYIRRHWIGLLATALALGGILGGAGVAMYQARVAQQQSVRAQRQFNSVRQLANKFLFDFNDQIANLPGTLKAQETIVSTAQEYLNRLAREASGDPGLQWELAAAYGKLAAVQGSRSSPSLNRTRDAIGSYEKALSLARPLGDGGLLNAEQQGELVELVRKEAQLRRVAGEHDQAVRLAQEAVTRSAGMTGEKRANALREAAIALSAAGDPTGGLNAAQKLLLLVRETARRDPSFENRVQLVLVLMLLPDLLDSLCLFSQENTAAAEALTLARAQAAERPYDRVLQRRLSTALELAGVAVAFEGKEPGVSEAVNLIQEAITALNPDLVADPHDATGRHFVGAAHILSAMTLADVHPRRALPHAAQAAEFLDAASPDDTEFRAWPRIIAADAHRNLGEFAAAERDLSVAERILKVMDTQPKADLELSAARLESARGNRDRARDRFRSAIVLYEKLLQKKKSVPAYVRVLADALGFAAAALPESSAAYRRRIVEIWSDENRRFPGNAWTEKRLAEAQSAVAHQ